MKDILRGNYLNFVKEVPMIYANFITTVTVVSEEKTGAITFVATFVLTSQFAEQH
jgi:hypothetical protein